MYASMLAHVPFSAVLLLATAVTTAQEFCKVRPTDAAWPTLSQWKALNQSISGRLIRSSPPGLVCRMGSQLYNNASCAELRRQWPNADWHAKNPFSIDYNDVSCPVDEVNATCSDRGYPAYVVNATEACHVQAAVHFARKTGVRLIIKGTGHDVPGRSAGAGALSIWTHYIQGITINHNDPLAVRIGGVASATISAGMRWGEVYAQAAKENVTILGGSDAHVGVGGWTLGAGHGPLTAKFGLGADQVLSMEVVTADGELRTVNETANPDLFWALRGGGGSTYAAMVSLTVKAYPAVIMSAYGFSYNATANSDAFWHMLAYFNTKVPDLMEAGVMGYYIPQLLVRGQRDSPKSDQSILGGILLAPGVSQQRLQELVTPIERTLNTSSWARGVTVGRTFHSDWTLEDFEASAGRESVGNSEREGSRLFDREALTMDIPRAAALLKRAFHVPTGFDAQPYPYLIGHMVAGPGPREVDIPGASNAVLPAWRKSYVHMVISTPLAGVGMAINEHDKARLTTSLRDDQVPVLAEMAPGTGAYMSEADPTTPNWQETFWGSNYPRLLAIKQKWDPQGVFWCIPCVGHELWTVGPGYAIGQGRGRICRRR